MNKHPETNNTPEGLEMEEQKRRWEQTMAEVVKHFYPDQDLPDQELVKNGPHLLEEHTFQELNQKVEQQFVIITAPSGAGKGTIGKVLEQKGLPKLPRVNTRGRRPGEDEDAYHFVSEAEFDQMLDQDQLLAPTDSGDNRAGIEKKPFFQAVESGKPFYIDSGAGTARQIRQLPELQEMSFPVTFILPPSFDEMVRRIKNRVSEERQALEADQKQGSTMDDELIQKRLDIAIQHLSESKNTTDLFVVNDEVDRAAGKILSLFPRK